MSNGRAVRRDGAIINPSHEWLVAALTYSDRLALDELLRKANENSFRAFILHALLAGDTPEKILADVRASAEWQNAHTPAPGPPPTPPPPPIEVPGAKGVVRFYGERAVGDEDGPKLYVGLSRFYWLWAWRYDRDRVLREMDKDRALGYRYARVLAQVGDPNDPKDYWVGRIANAGWRDHLELVASLTRVAAERGLLILWTLFGKGGPVQHSEYRPPYVHGVSTVLRDCAAGVLTQEVMNEPMVGGDISLDELLELWHIAKEAAPALPTATGAVWTERGWVSADPDYAADTGFSPEGWEKTQREVGIAHLDRWQPNLPNPENIDRPWRQPWDVGLESKRWVDNEHVGPGASVHSETRPTVLRSMRAVAFISRAFASCLHGAAGIRGDIPWEGQPGYVEAPHAVRFLPGTLPNGRQQNANANFPDRPYDLSDEYVRSISGKGIVRAYSCQDAGICYTVPFGPVSAYQLVSRANFHVECFQQDVNDLLWERDVARGEVIDFPDPAVDYLLVSHPR